METDSVPLLVVDQGQQDEEASDQPDFKKMVFFHGKELSGRSFVRVPQHNLVRIGIGEQGVYKMDSKTPKVLEHWEFSEIKDYTFSGYSFTLQLRSGGDYYIRTDDGEPICAYIDLFQKDPEKALEQARNNPPMSKVPESGVLTLRRKFSSEPQGPHNDFKFFTLNRRVGRSKDHDPISKLTQQQNIEVDSRLRSERGFSIDTNKTRPRSLGSHELQKLEQSGGGGGRLNGGTEHKNVEKRQARDVLVNKITEAAGKEKRLSNGIRVSPVSTKGEVTTTQSTTKATPPTTAASTPPPSSTQSPKRGTKGGGEEQPSSSQRETPVSDSSSDTIPILRPESSTSSGGPFSPTDEFQFMAGSEGEPLIQKAKEGGRKLTKDKKSASSSLKKDKQPSSSVSPEELYDKLEPYEQLSVSESESGSSRTTPAPVTPTPSNPGLTLTVAKDNGSCWSDESGEYDHLPPALDSLPEKGQIHLDQLLGVSAYRRITSQPALSTPASARESPIDRSPSHVIQEETSEEEDEDDELGDSFELGKSPTNLEAEEGVKGQTEGSGSEVVFRKRNRHHLDPFADILGSAHAAARLRWSQELNPLYDYIKGYKISESVKLYDSPSKLLKSTNASDLHRKSADGGELGGGGGRVSAPSIIVEEESEPSSREQTCSPSESQGEGEGDDDEEKCELEIPHETSTLPRARRPHLYEEISFADRGAEEERPASEMGMVEKLKLASKKNKSLYEKEAQKGALAHLIGRSDTSPTQHRKRMEKAGVSPRIGKRELLQHQRRSRTINSLDDSATEKRKQRSMRAGDSLKDFSFVMREYRLFFVKLPNGLMCREIFNITKPISELREKLCDHIGADNPDHYQLYVEGACLTFLKEGESSNVGDGKVNRAGSFTHIVDSQGLPDQGTEPFRLKSNLSFRMQGISTSRILSLMADDEATNSSLTLSEELIPDPEEDFHKNWMSIVHGSVPCCLDDAVKLAALQYQSYFLDRTAVHSVVGFCRPTEFLPLEYSGIRGIEQKMYKEQEILKMKNHKDIKAAYNLHCSKLSTYDAVFFPAREPRKKLLQSTKLKPIIIGVGSQGVLRVDPKTKEVLDTWHYSCLRNWAYSKRTFVLAFANKNYPVESNQAKWICQLIDFHVDMLAAQRHRQLLREEDRMSSPGDVFPPA